MKLTSSTVLYGVRKAENAANFLKKGSLAGVDGRLQSRSYEGQDGRSVYVTEVVAESVQFLDRKVAVGIRNAVTLLTLEDLDKALHLEIIRTVTKVIKVILALMMIHLQIMARQLTFQMTIYRFNSVDPEYKIL